MDSTNEVVFAQFFTGAALLCFAYGYMYRRTKVDRFREDMFSIRDEVFDYMWKHDLLYSEPAYVLTRSALNGAIKFGAYWSLPSFVLVAFYARRSESHNGLTEAIGSLALQDHRLYFNEVRDRIWRRLITFIFLEGVFGWMIGAVRRTRRYLRFDHMIWSLAESMTDELIVVGTARAKARPTLYGRSAA